MKKFTLALLFVCLLWSTANAAEILIRWTDTPAGSGYNRLDVVSCHPDDQPWGRVDPRVNPDSDFIIVQLTGLDCLVFEQYYQPYYANPDDLLPLRERQYGFDETKIPQNVINQINNNNGFIVITTNQWNSYIKNWEGLIP